MADDKTVSDERLHDYLRAYAKTIKLTSPKFRITEGTNKGDNFVSLVYRVTLEGLEDGIEAKRIELILKTTRTYLSGEVLSSTRVTPLFERETFFYQEVLPIFQETLKEYGGMANRFPILYDANDESGKELLVLENLTPQGFVMAKSKILDYPHLILVMRCLGEFHAYSFITRAVNPTGFEKMRQMKEHVFQKRTDDNADIQAELDQSEDKIKNISKVLFEAVFKALEDDDKHYSERYQRFVENIEQNLKDATDGKATEPYAVVNHGDCWTNNILFKYDKEKNPCDLRFVDLQISRYASPVLDLLYLLFCCCTQETRSNYYDELINEYYETLSNTIERAGFDPNVLFPHELFIEHFTKFGKFAAAMATYTIHIFTSNDVDLESTYDSNYVKDRIQNDSFYKSMLRGTFKDLVDRNYI